MSKAVDIMLSVLEEQINRQTENSLWGDSDFKLAELLKNDYSGKAGEVYIARLCDQLGIENLYVEDEINQNDGTYDIVINNKRVEIKTARLGTSGSWQHESLRDYGSDYFLFLDIAPDGLYLSIFESNFDFSKRHPVFGRTPHLRKETGGTYKFDFGNASHKKGLESGYTLLINGHTSDFEIKNFINKRAYSTTKV